MKFQRPHATPDGPALRYREGQFNELHAFLGDALVFDGRGINWSQFQVRFYGGRLDGQTKAIGVAREYLNPLKYQNGTIVYEVYVPTVPGVATFSGLRDA